MPSKTNAQLTAELKAANEELAILRGSDAAKALEEFKTKVKQRALEAKTEHGWCETIDDILKDLGIDPAMPRFRFTVMVPLTFEVTQREVQDNPDQDFAEWIASCVNKDAIVDTVEELGQDYSDSEDAILSRAWDTTEPGYDDSNHPGWKVKVGDITVQNVEQIKE